MNPTIPESVRKLVAARADFRCEYCHLPQSVSFYRFHIDHIRSQKHDGSSDLSNLAWACPDCNYFKGTDLGSYSPTDEAQLVRFFNPRTDVWYDHFQLDGGQILGRTEIGLATERIFKFNETDRLIFRMQLFETGISFD